MSGPRGACIENEETLVTDKVNPMLDRLYLELLGHEGFVCTSPLIAS